jgi:hypothetical protein
LARIEDTPTKTGSTVADLPASSITPAAVDKIYAKLQTGPAATEFVRPICPSTLPGVPGMWSRGSTPRLCRPTTLGRAWSGIRASEPSRLPREKSLTP